MRAVAVGSLAVGTRARGSLAVGSVALSQILSGWDPSQWGGTHRAGGWEASQWGSAEWGTRALGRVAWEDGEVSQWAPSEWGRPRWRQSQRARAPSRSAPVRTAAVGATARTGALIIAKQASPTAACDPSRPGAPAWDAPHQGATKPSATRATPGPYLARAMRNALLSPQPSRRHPTFDETPWCAASRYRSRIGISAPVVCASRPSSSPRSHQ